MRLVRPSLILVAVLLTSLATTTVAEAGAASGGLRFVECLSGRGAAPGKKRPTPAGGCKAARNATGNGEATGIDHLLGLTSSPDGRSLYAVSTRSDAVSAFATRPLSLSECFTTFTKLGRDRKQPCRLLPHPGTEDATSGFNSVNFVTVSPDGRNVYTISAEDRAIGTFARSPSGRLTYKGCITGDRSKYGTVATGACKPIPTATDSFGGVFSGLAGPRSLTVSPDGRFVYVALAEEPGIATMARAPDGSLHLVSCLRGVTRHDEAGGVGSPCPLVAPETNNPNGSGLRSPRRLVISADGTSLYAISSRRAAIAEFRVDTASGALTFSGCLSAANRGTGPGDPCRYVPQATEIGSATAMDEMREAVIAPDGTALYGLSGFEEAVSAFARDPLTGALSFVSCVAAADVGAAEFGVADPCTKASGTRDGSSSGLSGPHGLAISPDGRSLFVASSGDEAINRFRLTPGGGLTLAGCLTADSNTVGRCARAKTPDGKPQKLGFNGFDSLAVAGHDLYAAAGSGASVSRFTFP